MWKISLNEHVVWVNGGSRGIGRAIALAMAEAGARVAITYRSNKVDAFATVDMILARGGSAMAVAADNRNEAALAAAHKQIVGNYGPISILVNAAGVISDGLFLTLEESHWDQVLQTNVMGTVHAIRQVTPDMMSRRFGRIINISSAAAQKSGKGQSNYAASKGAIEALTRSLAVELGARGITVNAIAPGVIATDMTKDLLAVAKEDIMQRQVLKRVGAVDDISGWAVMLASRHGDFMTGQVIAVDGGLKMV